jgi:hypothetical protein
MEDSIILKFYLGIDDMPKFKIDVKGIDKILEKLDDFPPDLEKEISRVMFREANIVIGESKRLVPVFTGALRASATVLKPETKAGVITVQMGYGSFAVQYALKQHEDLTLHHRIGRAKYLEEPFNANKKEFRNEIIKAVRDYVNRKSE